MFGIELQCGGIGLRRAANIAELQALGGQGERFDELCGRRLGRFVRIQRDLDVERAPQVIPQVNEIFFVNGVAVVAKLLSKQHC